MKDKIVHNDTQNSDKPENKRFNIILPKIVIALLILFIILGALFYLFFIGWGVKPDDIIITYSSVVNNDNGTKDISIDFKLKNGNILKVNTDDSTCHQEKIELNQCIKNPFDNTSDSFNLKYTYISQDGEKTNWSDDVLIIVYKNKTEKIYIIDLIKKYGE